jgi:hypothetical protein
MRNLLNRLAGVLAPCWHRRLGRPYTGTTKQTTVCCLDCGRRFHYDWATMRRGAEVRPAGSSPYLERIETHA